MERGSCRRSSLEVTPLIDTPSVEALVRELDVLIRARYPLLYIVSWEEKRVEDALRGIAQRRAKRLFVWSVTQGLVFSPTATDDTAAATRRPRQPRRAKATAAPRRSDEHLLAQLADLPRGRDGKVSVRRAAAALGTGPDRARRLLAQAGLRRVPDQDDPTSTAVAPQSPVPVPRTDHHQDG